MNSRSSQLGSWIIASLLTASLYAAALTWGHFSIPLSPPPLKKPELINLNLIDLTPPTEKIVQKTPAEKIPPREKTPALTEPPPQTSPSPSPSPPLKTPSQKVAEAPSLPKEKIDPAILLREKQKAEQQERKRTEEIARQRQLAKKRAEVKRQQQKNAEQAAAAKKRATAKAKAAAQTRAAEAKRIVSTPSALSRPSPKYPRSARRAGHEGTVKLSFTVSPLGKVTSIQISQSSGHSSLDQAALSAIRKWRFKPARNGLGQAVSYRYTLPIPFRLR